MAANEEVTMMMSVVPGAMTGISTMMSGLVSINNVFLDMTRQVDATFGLIDSSIVTAGTVVAQLGFKAAEAFGEFEQGMKVVQMVSNQTAADMDILKQKANEFSVSYRTDIDQITEGLQTLGRAGLNSASEQTEVLQNGLSTAKLESRELNSVLEELIQNTALLGGDLKSSDFGEVSTYLNDLLVATSMTAPITTHDVSETLKYSGGIAAAAGANVNTEEGKALLEDYMAAIAAFAQKGVTGSIAGTALRAFFTKPASQDSSVTDALSSIHLKPEYLWEDDEQTMKPVSEQIRIIKDQMDELNVSTMDQLQIWSKIVGGKMGQQMMKLDSDSIKDITKDIQAADSAQSKAAGTFQTFQSNMKEMTEQGQVAFREFGENVTRVLNPLIELLTKFLEILSNPVSSATLFAGFMAIIGQAYQKIKNIFSSLKAEFSTIMDYIGSNSKLMAMRPSYERYHGKTHDIKDTMKYYNENDPAIAFKKEFEKQQEEELLKYGEARKFTPGMYAIYKDSKKWNEELATGSMLKNLMVHDDFSEKLGLSGKKPTFGLLVSELLDKGLWDEKWTKALYDPVNSMSIEDFQKTFEKEMTEKLVQSRQYSPVTKDYENKIEKITAFNVKNKKIDDFFENFLIDEPGYYSYKDPEGVDKGNRSQKDKLDMHSARRVVLPEIRAIVESYFRDKHHLAPDMSVNSYIEKASEEDLEAIRDILRRDLRFKDKKFLYDKNNGPEMIMGPGGPHDIRAIPVDNSQTKYKEKLSYENDEGWDEAFEAAARQKRDDEANYVYNLFRQSRKILGLSRQEFALMSPDKFRKLYHQKIGSKHDTIGIINAHDSSIQTAMDMVAEDIWGGKEGAQKVRDDYAKQVKYTVPTEERFLQPGYQDFLKGYSERQIFGPTGELLATDKPPIQYFDVGSKKWKKVTKKDYVQVMDGFTERTYFSKSLFHKMAQQEEMDKGMIQAFVLANSESIAVFKDMFQDEKGKNLSFNVPGEMLFDERKIGYDDFAELRLSNGAKIGDSLAGSTRATKNAMFQRFQRALNKRREEFAYLYDVANHWRVDDWDHPLSDVNMAPLDKVDNRQQLTELGVILGLDLEDYDNADSMKTEIYDAFGKNDVDFWKNIEPSLVNEFEKKTYRPANLKLIAEMLKLEFKQNEGNKSLINKIEKEVRARLNRAKKYDRILKKFGNKFENYDDSAMEQEMAEFAAFMHEYNNFYKYIENLDENPYGGSGPHTAYMDIPGGREEAEKYLKEYEEEEERKKEELKRKKESLEEQATLKDVYSSRTTPGSAQAAYYAHLHQGDRKKDLDAIEEKRREKDFYGEFFETDDDYFNERTRLLEELNQENEVKAQQALNRLKNRINKELADDEFSYLAYDASIIQDILPTVRKAEDRSAQQDYNKYVYEHGLQGYTPELYTHNIQEINDQLFAKSFRERLMEKMPSNPFSGLGDKISSILLKERPDRLIGAASNSTKMGKLANITGNLVDLAGGPLMVAIEGVTAAIQLWQQAYQSYTEDLKETSEQLKDAYASRDSAESDLRRAYQKSNPDATDEELNQMVYDTYSTMGDDMSKALNNGESEWFKKLNLDAEQGTKFEYDEEAGDGSTKPVEEEELSEEEANAQAIKENTGALYFATAELSNSLSKMSTKMNDSWWGIDGWTGWLTDQFGGFMDKALGWFSGAGDDDTFGIGSKFSDANEFLMTQSQRDENYSGYTEMAGLMMEDFKDAGDNWIVGMRTMMGSDVKDLARLLPKTGYDHLSNLSKDISGIDKITNSKIQASMKNDTKTWKSLAKEIAKRDVNKKLGKDIKANSKRIEGLMGKLQRTIGSGFTSTRAMQAAYLVQMQEMYAITQQAIVPTIQTNAELAAGTLTQASGISAKTEATSNNAGGTWGTAQVISGLVAIIAKTSAKEAAWQSAYEADPESTDLNGDGYDETDKAIIELAQNSDSADDFAKEAAKKYNSALYSDVGSHNRGAITFNKDREKDMGAALYIAQIYGEAAKMTGYNYTADGAKEFMKDWFGGLQGNEKLSDIYNTLGKNYTENPEFHQKIIDTYLSSGDDDGDGSGGGGSGSGSGNKDKDQGTKKERVDLVLCNKKEIPKLNVNLFKKAPSFTILNKNFKLRDIKVNTQDKPKAVLASIKNAIIDVQKRTDPKIIQDEEAIYDPVGATDGNTPSGTSDVRTNTG